MKNWLLDTLFGKAAPEVKETFTTKESNVPPFLKEAAWSPGETLEETIKKDWERQCSATSNLVLAERITELEVQNNGQPEKWAEYFREVFMEVQKNRKKAEERLFKLIPRHSLLDCSDFFRRIKEQNAKEIDAKDRALKKSAAGTKFKDGDCLVTKSLPRTYAYVVYVDMENKTYTIIVNGTMAPTFYSWEDAHDVFEKDKNESLKKNELKKANKVYTLEQQDSDGFWQTLRTSSFLEEINLKVAHVLEVTPEAYLRVTAEDQVDPPKFKAGDDINDGTTNLKVVQVDDQNGIYLLEAPGFKAPVRYTFEVAHMAFKPGSIAHQQIKDPAPATPSREAEKLIDNIKVSLQGKSIIVAFTEGVSLATYSSIKEAADAFEKITLKNHLDEMFDIQIPDLEKEAGSFVPPDVFQQIVDDAHTNKLTEEQLKVKYPQLTPESIASVLDRAKTEPPRPIRSADGSEGDPGMGVAPINGTGVFVEPNRGGTNVMQSQETEIKKEAIGNHHDACPAGYKVGEECICKKLYSQDPNADKGTPQAKQPHESAMGQRWYCLTEGKEVTSEQQFHCKMENHKTELLQSLPSRKASQEIEDGSTFEIGEVALLNSRIGQLEEGTEIVVVGLQGASVVFEAAHQPNIKGFTKFSKLDKIAKEKYQWLNEDLQAKFDVGDTVRVGNINYDGHNLKGKSGKVIEKVIMTPHDLKGKWEMFYKVELDGSYPVTLPPDVLKKSNVGKKASLSFLDEEPEIIEATLDKIAKVVHRKGKWCVVSEKSGRNLGCYESKEAAVKRLQQVEYFKHKKGNLEALTQEEEDEIEKGVCIEVGDINMGEGSKLSIKPREVPKALLEEKSSLKTAVQMPNLNVVQDFLDSFKVPPTVVSDTMVQEYLQQQNLTASKEDLKEIYQLLQTNNVEVRITVNEPTTVKPVNPVKGPTKSDQQTDITKSAEDAPGSSKIGPETIDSANGISVGDIVSYKTEASGEIDDLPAGTKVAGRVILLRIQKPELDPRTGQQMDPSQKDEVSASVMWDKDEYGTSHGIALSALSKENMDTSSAKYKSEDTQSDGTKVTVEKEINTEVPEMTVKDETGKETRFVKE